MKWYHPGWIKDYLQHNNFIKISVSAILIFTIVGTFCWPLFFWGLGYAALPIYFIISFGEIFQLYKLLYRKKKWTSNNRIYGSFRMKVFLLIAYSVSGLYLSGYLFMGIALLLGGDFP